MQAHIKIFGDLATFDALHPLEVLSLGNGARLSHHCIPAAGH